MNWLLFAISALAVFRLSLMFSEEEGPLAIFSKMRRSVPAKTNPGRGIRCPWCWSVWWSFAVTAYLVWSGFVPLQVSPLYAFAVSGVAVLLHKIV